MSETGHEAPGPDAGTARRATEADLDGLRPLLRAFCEADRHPFDAARIESALVPLLRSDEHGQVWVLDAAGRLTGYAVVTWSYSLESGGRDCILDEIYVAQQGHGAGSALLTAALRGAVDAGALAVFLETEAHNDRARRFYARHGFDVEDSIWMSRPLPR